MKKRHSVVIATIAMGFTLIGMDKPESEFALDLTSAKLPIVTKPGTINFEKAAEAFKTLTKDRALILKSLVAKELAGQYCPELHQAEVLLSGIGYYECIRQLQNTPLDEIADDETKQFLSRVVQKPMRRFYLMIGLKNNYPSSCGEALKDNYVVNAYGSFEPYEDRMITPLHHVLCRFAQGSVDHKYAMHNTNMLLQNNANPNARDDFGNTPMHHVPNPELVGLLLEYGANYDQYGYENRTPLHNHIRIKNWSVVRCLLKLPEVDVNACDDNKDTPLHEAVRQDAPIDIIESLLGNGARYDQSNKQYQNALGMAERKIKTLNLFYLDEIESLLCKEACCDQCNKQCQTVLSMAKHKLNMLNLFYQHLKYRLCNAIAENDVQEIQFLLYGYDFNDKDLLYWAQKFYPNSEGTKMLGNYFNRRHNQG